MSLFKRLDSVFLPVTDVEASSAWYETHLGMSLEMKDTKWKYYSLQLKGAENDPIPWITLYEVKQVTPMEHMPFNLYTPDGMARYTDMKEKGLQVTEMIDTGSMLVFEVIDPDGNRIGIVSWPEAE
ncbi:VOC family protein [Marinicrinis sediminis]|uniref:VOC family protein n=1 Tax=Marinicrinis sediminis TaxID=1652465 RepID=A0ABW5REB2_9BACL